MLLQRILSALVFIPIIFAAIWFGDPWFSLLVGIVAILGVMEFYKMPAHHQGQTLTVFGVVWTVLFVLSSHWNDWHNGLVLPLLITSAVVFSLIWLVFRYRTEGAFTGWCWTLGGIFYIGWMLSHYIGLRALEDGRDWVLFVIFATFAADSCAFLVGRAWGRHPIAPLISPAKTVEGTIGGFVGAIAAAIALYYFLGLPIRLDKVIALGCLIGVFAHLGDLAESLLKRSSGIKESGRLIPGHGGILDRLDSIVFTGIVVYYYVEWAAL